MEGGAERTGDGCCFTLKYHERLSILKILIK